MSSVTELWVDKSNFRNTRTVETSQPVFFFTPTLVYRRNADWGPICMVNLLKFKPRTEYEDGRETQLNVETSGLSGQWLEGESQ